MQQRALGKYHSAGLWTNTCCSHPRPGEDIIAAGQRRLKEELGITANLTSLGWFQYNAHFSNGLSEHEIDHVLVGTVPEDVIVRVDRQEVSACRWITIDNLLHEMAEYPEMFTPWLEQALQMVTAVEKLQ